MQEKMLLMPKKNEKKGKAVYVGKNVVDTEKIEKKGKAVYVGKNNASTGKFDTK